MGTSRMEIQSTFNHNGSVETCKAQRLLSNVLCDKLVTYRRSKNCLHIQKTYKTRYADNGFNYRCSRAQQRFLLCFESRNGRRTGSGQYSFRLHFGKIAHSLRPRSGIQILSGRIRLNQLPLLQPSYLPGNTHSAP